MDFFETVNSRRSIRKYLPEPVPAQVIEKAIDAALRAPNSSNLQTWEFYWVKTARLKAQLVEACLSQSAARTAQELIVIVANPHLWKKTNPKMVEFAKQVQAPKLVHDYYAKLIPLTYGYTFLWPLRALILWARGLTKPTPRRPVRFRDLQTISLKSAALACENFMLAITAQGYGTCAMEGFDEVRVRDLLTLNRGAEIVMVIAVGLPDPVRGTWGPQIRFDREWFVKSV